MTIELTEAALLTCNNSPVPVQDVPLFLCISDSFTVDMSATDIDGDSLSYAFYTPFNGASQGNPAPAPPSPPPYLPFSWAASYSQNIQVHDVYLDNATGLLTGVRNALGYFAMGVCINEYRTGQLISKTYRDFSLTLVTCYELIAVEKIQESLEVSIWPNPVRAVFNIKLSDDDEATFRLLSSLGQELSTASFYNKTQFDLRDFPKGLYLLEVVVGNKRTLKKVIKE